MRTFLFISSLTFFFACLFAYPAVAGGPWKGRIIDIDTQEPLEDAVVLSEWTKIAPGIGEAAEYFYRAIEAVTDKNGYFEVPSYTPISFPPIITRVEGPDIIVFKPGYLSIHLEEVFLLPGSKEKAKKGQKRIIGRDIKEDNTYILKQSPGLIELPKLKNKRQRRLQLTLPSVPLKYIPNYLRLYDDEREFLGLHTYRPAKEDSQLR